MVDDGSKDKTTEVIILNLFCEHVTTFPFFLSSLLRSSTFQSHSKFVVMSHQVGLRYMRKYGADKVRVLTLVKNRGKGGAVRMVRQQMSNFCMSE